MAAAYFVLLLLLGGIWLATTRVERFIAPDLQGGQSNYSWFVAPWIPGLVLLLLPIYRYPEVFDLDDALYIALCHACFALGGLLAFGMPRSGVRRQAPMSYALLGQLVVMGLVGVGILGQLLQAIDVQLSGNISLSSRLSISGLQAVKSQYADLNQRSAFLGPLAGPVRYLAAMGQVGLAAYSLAAANRVPWARNRSLLFMAVLFLAALMVFNSVFTTGGRLALLLTVLLAGLPWTLDSAFRRSLGRRTIDIRRLLTRWSIPAVIGLVALIFLSTSFLGGRIGRSDPLHILKMAHRAEVNEVLQDVVENNPAAKSLILQGSYLTTTFPTLTYYLHLDDSALPGPEKGNLSFQALYLLVGKYIPGFDPKSGQYAYLNLQRPLTDAGYYGNVWSTMVREMLVDFGRVGAPLFFLTFGFLGNLARRAYFHAPTIELGVIYTMLRIQMVFAAFHSLLHHYLFGQALILATVALLMATLLRMVAPGAVTNAGVTPVRTS